MPNCNKCLQEEQAGKGAFKKKSCPLPTLATVGERRLRNSKFQQPYDVNDGSPAWKEWISVLISMELHPVALLAPLCVMVTLTPAT